MTGSPSQVEWAERIHRQVSDEFERVAAAFRSVAARQSPEKRARTEAIVAIVEEKKAEVLSRDQAGSFIKEWQQIGDQVRRMVAADPRYTAPHQPSRSPNRTTR